MHGVKGSQSLSFTLCDSLMEFLADKTLLQGLAGGIVRLKIPGSSSGSAFPIAGMVSIT